MTSQYTYELKTHYIQTHALEKHFGNELIKAMRLRHYSSGTFIIKQGTKLRSLFFLVKGKVQIEHYEKDGHQAVFSIENPFSAIGDLELFQDHLPGSLGTVKAISEVDLLELPLSIINDVGMKDPLFLRFMCQQLSSKLYVSATLHSSMSCRALDKISKYLLFKLPIKSNTIKLEKRDSIAALLGISVRQINRSLKTLAGSGAITFKNKTVTILNPDLLTKISEEG